MRGGAGARSCVWERRAQGAICIKAWSENDDVLVKRQASQVAVADAFAVGLLAACRSTVRFGVLRTSEAEL